MRPKLIFLVTEDWYFWSHRLPMARAAESARFEVAVATRVTAHGDRIRAAGFKLHPLDWRRRNFGPLASLAAVVEIYRLYRRERPFVVHHVALKPTILGGIAARLARVPGIVSMIAGAGYLATARGRNARLLAVAARWLWPTVLFRRGSRIIVQNDEDRRAVASLGRRSAQRIDMIPGSGVDLERFRPAPEPPEPIVFAYAGRMIAIKGVASLVAAHQILRRRGEDVRLLLAGAPDEENPSAIDRATLDRWAALLGVDWLGPVEDVRRVWERAHVAVLASLGGEGLPKVLLEAAAMGRPIVGTDIPGTRTIAHAGENALLVPPGNEAALADALAVLAHDRDLRRRFCGRLYPSISAIRDQHMGGLIIWILPAMMSAVAALAVLSALRPHEEKSPPTPNPDTRAVLASRWTGR
jgi:glycosyltransferase involved in cell wall biosynthesis